jgi:hypothetical protein
VPKTVPLPVTSLSACLGGLLQREPAVDDGPEFAPCEQVNLWPAGRDGRPAKELPLKDGSFEMALRSP